MISSTVSELFVYKTLWNDSYHLGILQSHEFLPPMCYPIANPTVAENLISDRKITTPDQLSCEGRSAGGLLIGAAINEAPELFKFALMGVPFVDVVCTMIDASIPLTVVEWKEWGNPNEAKYHEYMMEYSPINNVREGLKYPSCLLTGGLHDPRVQYWGK